MADEPDNGDGVSRPNTGVDVAGGSAGGTGQGETPSTPGKRPKKAPVVVAQVEVPKKKKEKKDPKEGKPDDTRQLLDLMICSIQLTELIPAHRFKKNSPWLSVLYGKEKSWTAPYQEADEGDQAEFLEVNWNFILQRDTRHRQDLIVIVNSEDVIIGRYILGKAEFVNVPNTASGFFKVSGDIINGLGKAGVIKIVFKKQVAEPPKAPRFIENITAEAALNHMLPHTAKTYIRIISIACVDLKSVSIFEANSPHILLTCGPGWTKTTDVSVGSGLSAKWNRLPWKLIMEKFHPLVLNVMSGDSLIGRIAVTLDELVTLPENQQGFIEFIRPISDGVRDSGRVRVVLLVRGMGGGDTIETFAVTSPEARKRELQFGEDTQGLFTEELYPPYGKSMDGPDLSYKPKPSSYVISGQCPGCPFIMIVREIGVFDAKSVNPRKANSLWVNGVCGKWGSSTPEIPNSGQNALWIDLQSTWKFTVESGCLLRFNVWSNQVYIGHVKLTAQELVNIPVDPDGGMEIMAKVMDGDKSWGRLRVIGTYEWWREHVVVAEKIIAPVVFKPAEAKKMVLEEDGDGVPQYDLPVLAMVMSISAMDLKAVHGIIPNSPKAKIVSDRKMAQTKSSRFGGREGRWTNLNWPVPINEGCIVNAYIYSGEIMIGWVEMQAHEIVRLPLDPYGLTVVNSPIFDIDGLSTGRVQIIMQLNNVMVEDYDRLATKEKANHYDLRPKPEKDINLRNPYVPDAEMKTYMENVSDQPVFFSLEETKRKNAGIMLKVQIRELDVTDLRPMHLLEKNSPIVSAACGKFAGTTKMQVRQGKDAFWENLNWNFLMNDEISLKFVVGSNQKTIGVVNILPPAFITGRADQRGIKRITLPIQDADNRFSGKIKVTYTLGVIREEGYISRPKMDHRHVDEVTMPFNAKIGRVVATGLASVHTFGPNKPKFRVQCDDWARLSYVYLPAHSSEGDEHDSSDALWPSIGWSVPVLNDELPIFFSIVSGKELIGSASILPMSLLEIPKTRDGITEYVTTLYNMQGKATGRLQVYIRCLGSGVSDAAADMDYDDPSLQEAMERLNNSVQDSDQQDGSVMSSSQSAMTPAGLSVKQSNLPALSASPMKNKFIGGGGGIDPASIFSPPGPSRAAGASPSGRYDSSPLPSTEGAAAGFKVPSYFTITVTGIAVINLRAAHLLSKNSPFVLLFCEDNEFHSDVRASAGKTATWDGLQWYFNVEHQHVIRIEIHSGDVVVGNIEWTAYDLFQASKGRAGGAKIFSEMKTGNRFDGKMKLSYVINGPKPPTPRKPEIELVSTEGDIAGSLSQNLQDGGLGEAGVLPERGSTNGYNPGPPPGPPPGLPPGNGVIHLDGEGDDEVLPFMHDDGSVVGMSMGFEDSREHNNDHEHNDEALNLDGEHSQHDLMLQDAGSVTGWDHHDEQSLR